MLRGDTLNLVGDDPCSESAGFDIWHCFFQLGRVHTYRHTLTAALAILAIPT